MPSYLVSITAWAVFWPVPIAAAFIAALLLFCCAPNAPRREHFLVLLSFALLGLVTGILAGFSRSPAIGAVLPAVLSLVGGLSIYLVTNAQADRALLATCVIALSGSLLLGTAWGSILRDDFERETTSVAQKKREALAEVEVREFRKSLGLSETPTPLQHKTD